MDINAICATVVLDDVTALINFENDPSLPIQIGFRLMFSAAVPGCPSQRVPAGIS